MTRQSSLAPLTLIRPHQDLLNARKVFGRFDKTLRFLSALSFKLFQHYKSITFTEVRLSSDVRTVSSETWITLLVCLPPRRAFTMTKTAKQETYLLYYCTSIDRRSLYRPASTHCAVFLYLTKRKERFCFVCHSS